MTAISGADATILRYQYRRVRNLRVNIAPLREVASATIASGTFTYPRAEYDVTSVTGFSAAKRNRLCRIFNGTTIVFEGTLRKNALDNGDTTGTIYIHPHVQGDTGTAQLEAYSISASDTVKIYDVTVAKSFISRLDSGTFYKRWDVSYVDQNEEPSPVPVIGADLQAYSADGSAVSFSLDASGSYSWNGNSITYLWEFPSGITITAGTTTTSSVTIDVDPGVYVIRCTVTDSVTTKSKRAERWIFVNDSSNDAFSDTYPVENLQIRQDENGIESTFTAYGDVSDTYLYTGAHVLITWDYEFSQDGDTWTTPSEAALYQRKVKCYVRDFTTSIDYDGIKMYSFRCQDIISYCDALPLAPQAMIRKPSPADWTQVHTDLMNVAFLARQTISLNSGAVLTMHDFDYGDFDTVTKENFKITEKSIGEALRRSARYIPGAMIQQSQSGTLMMRRSYSYEPLATRATYPTRFTFNDTDIINDIGYNLNELMRAGFTEGGAFVDGTTTTAYFYRRGLGAQMQGVSTERLEDFIASSENNGQWYVGQHHARVNANVQSISFIPLHDVFEVAERYKYSLGISAYDPMTRQVLASDGMITSIRYSFPTANDIEMACEFQPETIGQDATTVPQSPVDTTIYKPRKSYTWDFTIDNGGWSLNGQGEYYAGQGWGLASSGFFDTVSILKAIPTSGLTTNIISVTVYIEYVTPSSSTLAGLGGGNNYVSINNEGATLNVTVDDSEIDTRYDAFTTAFSALNIQMTSTDTAGGFSAFRHLIGFRTQNTTDVFYIRKVVMTYSGANYFTGGV